MKHFFYLHTKQAVQALLIMLRQPVSNVLTLVMIALVLSFPISLYLATSSIQQWLGTLTITPQITLFMQPSASHQDIETVRTALQQHTKIKQFEFVSKNQALADMEKRSGLQGLADGLDDNPLPDAFVITPKTLNPNALETLQKELSGLPMVEQAQFDSSWAKRLYSLIDMGKHLTLFLTIILAVALVLVTSNTVRMQILARHDEIVVSKLIGATDGFIRRPFMYQSLWQGLLAGLIAWGMTLWLTYAANPTIEQFSSLYGTTFTLRNLTYWEGLIVILITILLTMVGARLSSGRHLRKLEPS